MGSEVAVAELLEERANACQSCGAKSSLGSLCLDCEWEKLNLDDEEIIPIETKIETAQDEERKLLETFHSSRKLTAYDIYRQFVLDVPRLDIAFDGQVWKGHPTLLFMELFGEFKKKRKAFRVLSLFTQSELAPWFQLGRQKWVSSDDEHFLDGGRQRISVVSQTERFLFSSKRTLKELTITKPFRVVDFNQHECNVRFTVLLVVTHDLVNDSMLYAWTRSEAHDWTIVESAAFVSHDAPQTC